MKKNVTRRPQAPASRREAEERKALMQTRGRKGVHLPRINMAFTPENHDFIKTMSVVTGKTMTEFLNYILEEYRMGFGQDYESIVEMRKKVNAIMGKHSEQPSKEE